MTRKMTRKIAKLENLKLKPAKKCGKPETPVKGPGRRAGKRRGPKPKARSRNGTHRTPPGRGGERLRNSVNFFVSEESDDIAVAIVSKAKQGNIPSAKVIIGLTGADHLPVPKKKKRRGLSDAERMASECDPEEYRLSRLQPGQPEWDEEDERILQLAISCNGNIHSLPDPSNPAPAASETD